MARPSYPTKGKANIVRPLQVWCPRCDSWQIARMEVVVTLVHRHYCAGCGFVVMTDELSPPHPVFGRHAT